MTQRRADEDQPTLEELLRDLLHDPELWLDTPNNQFGGRTPRAVIAAGEQQKVYNLLRCADLGMW